MISLNVVVYSLFIIADHMLSPAQVASIGSMSGLDAPSISNAVSIAGTALVTIKTLSNGDHVMEY